MQNIKIGDFLKLKNGMVGKITDIRQNHVCLEFLDDSQGERLAEDGWYDNDCIFAKSSMEEALLQSFRSKQYIRKMFASAGC